MGSRSSKARFPRKAENPSAMNMLFGEFWRVPTSVGTGVNDKNGTGAGFGVKRGQGTGMDAPLKASHKYALTTITWFGSYEVQVSSVSM